MLKPADRKEPAAGPRWTPVVVGGTSAPAGRPAIAAPQVNPPPTHPPEGEAPVPHERLSPPVQDKARSALGDRIGLAGSIAAHLMAAVLALAFVETDMERAGEGTLAQAMQDGLIVIPIESVAAVPSVAEAPKSDADTPVTEQATDDSVQVDNPAAAPDAVPTEIVPPEAETEIVRPNTPVETVPPESVQAEQVPPESVQPDEAVELDDTPPPETPQTPTESAETVTPPVETAETVAPSAEDVVTAPAPEAFTTPTAEDTIAQAAPEVVEKPTELQQEAPPVTAEVPIPPVPPPPPEPQRPEPQRPPPPREVARRPDPPQRQQQRPEPPRPQVVAPTRQGQIGSERAPAPAAASQARAAQGMRAGTQGTGGAGQTIAGKALLPSYSARVLAHYRRHKAYPREARQRNVTGTARIAFTINASGAVTGVSLLASSGSPLLDEAALAAARRASPFPPIPPELGRSSMPFRVPVRFDLND